MADDKYYVDFNDLQAAVDSGQWRNDAGMLTWIFDEFNELVRRGRTAPIDFGRSDFWSAVVGEDFSPQRGGRMPPPSSDAAPETAPGLIYSDSKEPDEEEEFRDTVETVPIAQEEEEDGDSPRSPPSRPPPVDTPRDFYEIEKFSDVPVTKFKTQGTRYVVTFRNTAAVDDLDSLVLGIFERVLESVYAEGDPSDLLGLRILHPSLYAKSGFLLPFASQAEMTADRIWAALLQIMQSDDSISLDGGELELYFTRIRRVRGSGQHGRTPGWNDDWFKKHRHCFINISNTDDLCLARAVVVAIARREKDTDPEAAKQWEAIRKGDTNRYTLQKRMAVDLMERAGLGDHEGPCGERELEKIQAVLAQDGWRIKVLDSRSVLWKGPPVDSAKDIFLFYIDEENSDSGKGHYIVCTKPHAIFDRGYWCDECDKPFDDKRKHRCVRKCFCCFSLEPCEKTTWEYCAACNRHFVSRECFQKHLAVPGSNTRKDGAKKVRIGSSVCQRIRRCSTCGVIVDTSDKRKPPHRCGRVWCRNCELYHPEGEKRCFVRVVSKDKEKEKEKNNAAGSGSVRILELDELLDDNEDEENSKDGEPDAHHTKIFFDFESRAEKIASDEPGKPTVYEHESVLCVAVRLCDLCKEETRRRNFGTCPGKCGDNEYIFYGDRSRDEFCRWLFAEENRGAVAIAHNAKGYDSQYLMQYLFRVVKNKAPEVIMKGTQLMTLRVDGIRVIDSLCFLPMALAEFPKAFGLAELKKGYFPYKFIKKINSEYVGGWPDAWFYDPGGMKSAKRFEFYAWYFAQRGKRFDFRRELIEYCRSDVDILMKACLKFEEMMFELSDGVRVFDVAITISSACMYIYKRNFMEADTIALPPDGGYRRRERQSVSALKWLKWVAAEEKIEIRHARNDGEKKIGRFKVDGYCESNNTVYEFHGCVWHGCPRCFGSKFDKKLPGSALSFRAAYERTVDRIRYFEAQGYEVVQMWECDYRRKRRIDPEFARFIDSLRIYEPLDPRDALRGGRTNATRLLYKCRPGEYQSHLDVCSLYPWGLKYTPFPIGHPKILTEGFDEIPADSQPFFGLIKCEILPPARLLHPVLPTVVSKKLYFPLCWACARENRKDYCDHSDDERALRGTWVTTEVDAALDAGYRLRKIYEVWNYEEIAFYRPPGGNNDEGIFDRYRSRANEGRTAAKRKGLFTGYIDKFLKEKIEANGWPASAAGDDEKKAEFADECRRREGIMLDVGRVTKNPGIRSLAKLMLNSFWGKFGQRTNMARDEFFVDAGKFFELIHDPRVRVDDVNVVNRNVILVAHRKEEEFVEPTNHINAVVAAFTTANSRLKLFDVLNKLGDRVCYFDTDSVIYVTRPGDTYHPRKGNFLGDWTDELESYGEGAYIETFVSGGPKNYAYEIRKPDGKKAHKVRIRGFTLDYAAAKHLNFKTLKKKVELFLERRPDENPIVVTRPRIERGSEYSLRTVERSKKYRVVYDKRWVLPDASTLPYGTKKGL